MENTFYNIINAHLSAYPEMTPQDLMKLCFQSEFGPEHLVTDESRVAAYILSEWQSIPPDTEPRAPEDIGNGLVRFHLTAEYNMAEAAPLLAKLFCLTAKTHHGTIAGLEEKLRICAEIYGKTGGDPEEYFRNCRELGYPAVHHSDSFRGAYAPHYRLLRKDLACYFPLLLEIQRTGAGIIAIDGRCGSGKTRFAEIIAGVFDCNVIHTDDFYLPVEQRQEHWETFPGGNMDFQRLKTQVLEPLRQGKPALLQSYSCQKKAYSDPITVPPKPLTILEGSYSQHPALDTYYNKKIFLTCGDDVRLRRLTAREGDYVKMFEKLWIPMEEHYHNLCPLTADTLLVDTSTYFD